MNNYAHTNSHKLAMHQIVSFGIPFNILFSNALYGTTFIAFEHMQRYLQEFDLGIIAYETIYAMEIVTVVIQRQ